LPHDARKGDLFTKTDVLPHMLYRFNGDKWIKLQNKVTESYLNEEYIKHLVEQVELGIISIEELTDNEREEVNNINHTSNFT
jgi:hypothetical protein